MSKVWVVISSEIEDSFAEEEYHFNRVLGVFSTKEKAEAFGGDPSYDVQCFEVDGTGGEVTRNIPLDT